eukprot:3343930-Pyramimonas_sp.AAC.1
MPAIARSSHWIRNFVVRWKNSRYGSSGLWTKRLASDTFVHNWRMSPRGVRSWSIRFASLFPVRIAQPQLPQLVVRFRSRPSPRKARTSSRLRTRVMEDVFGVDPEVCEAADKDRQELESRTKQLRTFLTEASKN